MRSMTVPGSAAIKCVTLGTPRRAARDRQHSEIRCASRPKIAPRVGGPGGCCGGRHHQSSPAITARLLAALIQNGDAIPHAAMPPRAGSTARLILMDLSAAERSLAAEVWCTFHPAESKTLAAQIASPRPSQVAVTAQIERTNCESPACQARFRPEFGPIA
jgi:hypothetical protein